MDVCLREILTRRVLMYHNLNQQVPTKSMGDIVRYFYKWKKTDRYEPIYSEWTKIYKPK